MVSPSLSQICEPPFEDAFVLVVTISSGCSVPSSIASAAKSSAMIFVTDAG